MLMCAPICGYVRMNAETQAGQKRVLDHNYRQYNCPTWCYELNSDPLQEQNLFLNA